jgi:hypothetical protein
MDAYFASLRDDKTKLYPGRIFTCSKDLLLCEILSVDGGRISLRWKRGDTWDKPMDYGAYQFTHLFTSDWYHGEGDVRDRIRAERKSRTLTILEEMSF